LPWAKGAAERACLLLDPGVARLTGCDPGIEIHFDPSGKAETHATDENALAYQFRFHYADATP